MLLNQEGAFAGKAGMKRPKVNAITAMSIGGFILVMLLVAFDEIFDIPHHLFNAPPTPINWAKIGIELTFILMAGLLPVFILWRLNLKRQQVETA